MGVQWAWVQTRSIEDARNALFLAATGYLEREQLRARISPVNPASVDIEFKHLQEEELADLSNRPWVVATGIIPAEHIPSDVPDAETIRSQFGIPRTVRY